MQAARISSRIEAVTVFREGARVRRVAELVQGGASPGQGDDDVGDGESGYPRAVCLTGLPLAMLDASLRVAVQPPVAGATGILPVACDLRVALDVPDRDEDLPPPVDDELEAARREVRRLDGYIAQVKRELTRVQRLAVVQRPKAPGQGDAPAPPPESPTAARLALLELRRRREHALDTELAALTERYKHVTREAKKMAERFRRATTARQAHEHELRKAVVIALASPGAGVDPAAMAGAARLTLEYMVPGARWAPAYSVRLAGGDASFTMRAVVAQDTGEDWSGALLALSTADAESWSELPELSSLRIGRRQAQPRITGWRPPPAGAELLYTDYDRYRAARPRTDPATPVPRAAEESREITRQMRLYASSPQRQSAGLTASEDTTEFEQDELSALAEASAYDDMDDVPTSEVDKAPLRAPPAPAGPMVQAAPPGPMVTPAAMAPQRRGGLLSSLTGAGQRDKTAKPKPSMMLGVAPAKAHRARGGAPGEFEASFGLDDAIGAGGGGFDANAAMGSEPEVVAGDDLLAYGNLRMPAPHAPGRGALRLARPAEIYLELLAAQRIEFRFDIVEVVERAQRKASAVARSSLPPRHRLVRSDYYDYVYTADTPVDVPSDGAFHSLPLRAGDAPVATRYVVVPRENTDVFRIAELTNPMGAPILDGPIDIYLGGDFLLTGEAEFTPPGGVLRLGLGVEQAIKVSRNTAYREETAGLIRGSLALRHQLRIEVQNNLEHAIDCEVRERIPSIREDEDDIEISVDHTAPVWQPYQPDLAESPAEAELEGGYAWRLTIGGGERKSLEADYSIKISAKYELVGGNRREA